MHTKINTTKIPLLFLGAALFLSVNSYAAPEASTTQGTFPALREATDSELKPHIGLQLGYAEPGDDHDGAASYGIEAGFQPYIPLAAALEVNSFLTDRDNEDNLRRTSAIAKATYNFGGGIPLIKNSFVGAGLGAVIDTQGENETNLGIKYLAGFDFPLTGNGVTRSKAFSLGATASYLTVFDAQDTFALNGQLKYWF